MKENLSSNNSFSFAHWLFGRSLGLVTFIAFLSYWVQADSIIGVKDFPLGKVIFKNRVIHRIRQHRSNQVLTSPNPFMVFNFSIITFFQLGCILILCLTIGFIPQLSGFLSWIMYLSLSVVGEPFLSFQWDALLLETLFLSLPFLPLISIHRFSNPVQYSKWARILILLCSQN